MGAIMFKKKYMLIVWGALVFLVFIIGILSVTFNYVKLNREWALREFEEDIKAGSQQLQFYVESLHSDILRIEKNLANSNMKVSEELYGYMDFVMGHHPNAIQEIFILDVNGKVVASTNPVSVQSSFQESKYFKNTQHIPNKVYLSEAIIVSDLLNRSEVSPEIFIDPLDLGFVLHTGVYSKGVFKGAVLFMVRAEPFFNRYSMALTKLTSGYGFILQEDGRILFHRDVELRGKFLSDMPESSDLIKANNLLKKTEGKIVGYRAPGQHMIVTSEIQLENQRWILGISTTTSKVAQKALTTIYIFSWLSLLLGIIIFGLVFSLIRLAQAKEMREESEKRLRLMVEQAGAVLWTTDTELRFTSTQGRGLAALKTRPDQVRGQTLYEYFRTDNPQFVPIASHRRALNGKSVNYEQAYDGITFQTHLEPLRDTKGSITGVIGVALDITKRKKAEESLRESELRLRHLSSQLISAQEEERKRISLELHDEMGQALTAIGLNLISIGKKLPLEHAAMIKDKLAETMALLEKASDLVRDLSLDLRPSMLDDLGLLPTLRWYINSYEKRTEIPVIFETVNLEERLTSEVEIVLYRVVQESLNNIARHAQAKKVKIRIEHKNKTISVSIEDFGIGFNPDLVMSKTTLGNGIGLLGMRERVGLLGGSFSVRSREGQGTSIFVKLPLN